MKVEASRYLLSKMEVKLQTQVSFSTQPALWWVEESGPSSQSAQGSARRQLSLLEETKAHGGVLLEPSDKLNDVRVTQHKEES